MSYLVAVPELLSAAATDLAGIGSTLSAATRPRRVRPRGVLAAAEGEVSAALWNRDPSHDIATVLEQKPVMGPVPDEQQGEAIAFDDDGLGYVTTNEGTNRYLHEYRVPEE